MNAKITCKMWDHQHNLSTWATDKLSECGHAHWIAGCSVGKTLAALAIATTMKRTLVLTVKSAITNAWINDIKTKTDGFVIVAPSKGTVAQRQEAIIDMLDDSKQCIVILNYEAAALMDVKAIRKMDFQFVIADEVHKLKSHDSKRSKMLAIACQYIPYKLGMTGTSWNDRPTDIYGQFRFYQPRKEGKLLASELLGNWYQFFERYVTYYKIENIKIPTGYKNLDKLAEVIDPHTFYLKTEDAIALPPVQHINVVLPMTPEMKRAYRDMEDDMVVEFGEELMTATCTLACATRLHQLTSGVWTNTDLKEVRTLKEGSPKTEAALEILDSIGDAPVVIFTRFTIDVENLEHALDKAGITHLKVVGGTYQQDEWVAGKAQVLICNMSAGATGLNLQRARYGIYYSTGHSSTDYEQSLWRIRRPGSDITQHIVYYHIMIENSVDVEIQQAISSKQDVASQLLAGLRNRL